MAPYVSWISLIRKFERPSHEPRKSRPYTSVALPATIRTSGGICPETYGFGRYSNLNLDASHSNHYLIPYSLDLGGFLADSAWIAAASDPALHLSYVQPGARITWFELRHYLAQRPDTQIVYVRRAIRRSSRAGLPRSHQATAGRRGSSENSYSSGHSALRRAASVTGRPYEHADREKGEPIVSAKTVRTKPGGHRASSGVTSSPGKDRRHGHSPRVGSMRR